VLVWRHGGIPLSVTQMDDLLFLLAHCGNCKQWQPAGGCIKNVHDYLPPEKCWLSHFVALGAVALSFSKGLA
jgi:hypothetical protein